MTITNPENYYCAPHKNVSRRVFEEDLFTIDKEVEIMHSLLSTPIGKHRGAYAIAHSQIEDQHPLRFFVTANSVIINPVITNLEGRTPSLLKLEGCMSFPDKEKVHVKRYNKIKVEFQTILQKTPGGPLELSDTITRELSGIESEIFQHEIDHMDGKYIYEF